MEELDRLLDAKARREYLQQHADDRGSKTSQSCVRSPSAATLSSASAGGAPAETNEAVLCWLCGRVAKMRFGPCRVMWMCFQCFRMSYLCFILPVIDTPARRRSDADFLNLIGESEEEYGASTNSVGSVSLGSTWGEVIEPSRASFVMSASFLRNRQQQHHRHQGAAEIAGNTAALTSKATTGTAGLPPPTGSSSLLKDKASSAALITAKDASPPCWDCPQCTFTNEAAAKECAACGFVNSGTVICPVCSTPCPLRCITTAGTHVAKTAVSRCKNDKPHCIWNCRECGGFNTLDGDVCSLCHRPRYWACSQCTSLHSTTRMEDGLRYCNICGSYNTPDDVLNGQATIDKESTMANLVTAQKNANVDGLTDGIAHGDEVVFGVNDAHTIEEVQRQKAIAENTSRLEARLQRLNLTKHLQKRDGNCLFSALAHQLFGTERHHSLVRSMVVSYMRENEEEYSILFNGSEEWISYICSMRETGTWGDELCLNAAARCFRVNIHVITSDAERWHIVFQNENLGNSRRRMHVSQGKSSTTNVERCNTRPPALTASHNHTPLAQTGVCLFLAYLAPVHYDDISPKNVSGMVLSSIIIQEMNRRFAMHLKRLNINVNAAVVIPHGGGGSTTQLLSAAAATPPLSSKLPERLSAVPEPVILKTERSDHLLKDKLRSRPNSTTGSAGPGATATAVPSVPRSRGGTLSEAVSPRNDVTRTQPPISPPSGFNKRRDGDYDLESYFK